MFVRSSQDALSISALGWYLKNPIKTRVAIHKTTYDNCRSAWMLASLWLQKPNLKVPFTLWQEPSAKYNELRNLQKHGKYQH